MNQNGFHTRVRILCIAFFIAFQCCAFAQDNSSAPKHFIGFTPVFNQFRISYLYHYDASRSYYADVGYQFRYIPSYERLSRVQIGVLPILASHGPLAEVGIAGKVKTHMISLGVLYKLNFIESGHDSYVEYLDGLNLEERLYSREDHHIVIKGIWMFRSQHVMQPYLGIGIKGVLSKYDIIFSTMPDIAGRIWFSPTYHVGIRIFPFRILSKSANDEPIIQ
ncbi:hypothetical protein OAA53_01525 [Salibacteraceae bacterium]|jgi:hypothetical protein|nr:hypothetical protein [Flavobacteriales bacterium]MDB9701393.1 hypothetical protein [Salibacteraceae bacterium]